MSQAIKKWGWTFTPIKGKAEISFNRLKLTIEDTLENLIKNSYKKILVSQIVIRHAQNLNALSIAVLEVLNTKEDGGETRENSFLRIKEELEKEFWEGLQLLGIKEESQKDKILIQLLSELMKLNRR